MPFVLVSRKKMLQTFQTLCSNKYMKEWGKTK